MSGNARIGDDDMRHFDNGCVWDVRAKAPLCSRKLSCAGVGGCAIEEGRWRMLHLARRVVGGGGRTDMFILSMV